MIEIAFNGVHNTRALSKVVRFSPQWLRSIRHKVARGIQCAEADTMRSMAEAVSSKVDSESLIFVSSPAFDGTSQRLRVQLPIKVSSAWHVLVSMQHLIFSMYDSETATTRSSLLELLRPLAPLAPLVAEALHDGLFKHKSADAYAKAVDAAMAKADVVTSTGTGARQTTG